MVLDGLLADIYIYIRLFSGYQSTDAMFTRAVFSARHKIHNTHHWRHRDLLMRNVRTAHPAGSAADRTRIQHTHSQAVIFPGNKSLHDKTFARYLTSAAASVKIKIDEKYDEGNRTTIQKHDKYLELHHNGQEFTIPYIWLKDNCRCPNCIHANSKQKNIHRKLTLGTVTSNIELNEAGTLLKIQCKFYFLYRPLVSETKFYMKKIL